MKKTMKKGFLRELKQTRGRFISIMLLMFLSTFTLVGLKLVGPDIRAMANQYLDQYNLADLSVISTYGLNAEDVSLLNNQITDAKIEYGYFADVTLGDTNTALRLFSQPASISEVELVAGRLPTASGEIALSNQMRKDYPLGSVITVKEKGEDANQVLAVNQFEVVGYVNSLEILQTMDLGSTNVGTGSLNGYGVISTNDFDSEVYMIARFYYDDLRGQDAFLNQYLNAVSVKKDVVEAALADRPQARLEEIQSEANAEIDAKLQILNDAEHQLAEGKQELMDAKQQLDEAKVVLDNTYNQIITGQTQIDEAYIKLEAAKQQVEDGYLELVQNQAQLDQSQAKISQGMTAVSSKQSDLDNAKQELDTNQTTITDSLNQLELGKTQYQQTINTIESNIEELNKLLQNPTLPPQTVISYEQQLAVLNQTLEATQNEYQRFLMETYNPGVDQLTIAQSKIDSGYRQITAGKNELNQTREQLNSGQLKVDDGQAQIDAGYQKLAIASDKLAESEQRLIDAQVQINQAQAEYQNGVDKYQMGVDKYQTGVFEYNQQEPEVRQQISEGYAKIADAQTDIDNLSLPVYTVNTRSETATSGGYQLLTSLATSIDKVANVFPILLYAVAALVTFTTMTRYVEDERLNTGTLLSLGYSESEIIKKYIIYGAVASSSGAILGIILGAWFIPELLYTAFRGQFTTPDLVLTFNFGVAIIALVVSVLCAVIPAFVVSTAEFKTSPASLLLPKPPSNGSKIFMERIGPIWNRLSFAHKVTARNIFRYKKRMFMTIFGVSGSVALLFTGLGMQGSIGNISPIQFGEIIDYDMIAVVDDNIEDNQAMVIEQYLSQENVSSYKPVYVENVTVEAGDNNERQTIALNVANNFDDYVMFRDRVTQQPIKLKDGEVIISDRLADVKDIEVGDTITVMSAENLPVDLKVGGITEMYMGHFMYATPTTYEQAFGKPAELNSYLVKLKDNSPSKVTAFATDVIKLDGVTTVIQNQSLINQVDSMAESLNSVMKLIIVLATLLAVVILYNITNINVNERMRELSTTKVLGYYDQEVTMYIYRETIILSLIGIGVGYGFGRLIHLFMMHAVSPLNMMFDQGVVISAFIAPALLIIIVSVGLGIIVHYKLKKVDMLEALKSVE